MFATSFILLVLSLTKKVSSESYLTKCCPPGKIFSGQWNTSKVNCVSVPNSRIEVEVFQWNATEVFQDFPRCDKLEDIRTTRIYNFDNNFEEIFEVNRIIRDNLQKIYFLYKMKIASYDRRLVCACSVFVNLNFGHISFELKKSTTPLIVNHTFHLSEYIISHDIFCSLERR